MSFAPLLETDRSEFLQEPWADAVYGPAWTLFAGHPQVRKLIVGDSLVGLVRIGSCAQGMRILTESLLETCPANGLKGVERVLAARLMVASYLSGADGQVRVKSQGKAEGFYRRLGFRKNRLPSGYDLVRDSARALFEEVTEP